MSMIKVAFAVTHEVYGMLQASAARAGQALPVYLRDAVFKVAQIDASALEAQPVQGAPKLTRTRRDVLTLLQKQREASPNVPYLTTGQIGGALSQSDQSVYLNLRYLLREGMIERGSNMQRQGAPGAPYKTYSIAPLGTRALSDDQTRVERAHAEFQARSAQAYADLGQGPKPAKSDQTYAPQVHSALRYIAMAQLGRAIESEADLEATKVTHERLKAASDADVSSGAHTYAQILEKVMAKIQALGGYEAISERFNIG